MKKLLLGMAIATLGVSGIGASAGATENCTISNTGPHSSNSCVVKEDFTCEVENNNKFKIINNNDQTAISGDATVSNNTSGGGAASGSATNSNGTVIDVVIENGGCTVTTVTPPAPSAPVAPVGGSGSVPAPQVGGAGSVNQPAQVRPVGGTGAVAPVAAPQRTAPEVLPYTSAKSAFGLVAAIIAAFGAVIVGSRAAISTYSKTQL